MRRLPDERECLARAKARLDSLDLYDVPVSLARVRVLHAPQLFRIPGFRRYHGYTFWRTIVVRDENAPPDLLTHELCHVWQAQRRPIAQLWAWVRHPYRSNPFEREARAAVDATDRASRGASDAYDRRGGGCSEDTSCAERASLSAGQREDRRPRNAPRR